MKKAGFFLIEILIYLVISSIFFILLFQFTIENYIEYKKNCFYNSCNLSIFSALDLITRDISSFSSNLKNWKKFENSYFVYGSEDGTDKSTGWYFKSNKLYRVEGQYHANKWNKAIKSLVCTNLEKFSVQMNKPLYTYKSNDSKKISILTIILEAHIDNKLIKVQKSVSTKCGIL